MLIDTHCHLTLPPLSENAEAHWSQAKAAGVSQAVVVGIDLESSRATVDFVAPLAGLWACVGIHPNETARSTAEDFQAIESLVHHPKTVAVGESGVDLYWDESPLTTQQRALAQHAELALSVQKPLVLHIRDAFDEACDVLKDFGSGVRGIVHCFSGTPRDAERFLEWGYAVSFAGNLTYSKAQDLRDAARLVPLEQCLVETDAPWLTPVPLRGKRNTPAYVFHTARCLAEVKGLEFAEVARVTTRNAIRIFGFDDIDPERVVSERPHPGSESRGPDRDPSGGDRTPTDPDETGSAG